MTTPNRFLDDMARVAGGAVSAVTGLKGDAQSALRRQMEHLLVDMDLISRDEFDAVKAMASRARAEQEKLETRVSELEAQLKTSKKATPKTARKPATKPATKA